MCRGGRIFAPVRVWRRWHRRVNVNQKRYAVASALAASAIPALVQARGHNIQQIPEVPLVVANSAVDSITKTSNARKLLETLKAYADVERVAATDKKRSGRSKWRNRPKQRRVGPLIITHKALTRVQAAFRNLPGVEVASVEDLNILRLAPGGHLGRFIIWTQLAFERLDAIFGTDRKPSSVKQNYWLPRPILTNPDLARIFNSDQVAHLVRPKAVRTPKTGNKPNYIVNKLALSKLNPYYLVQRRAAHRQALLQEQKLKAKKRVIRKRVTALRKAAKTPEGKIALAKYKAKHNAKIRKTNAIKKQKYSKYRRIIHGLPPKAKRSEKKKEEEKKPRAEKKVTKWWLKGTKKIAKKPSTYGRRKRQLDQAAANAANA